MKIQTSRHFLARLARCCVARLLAAGASLSALFATVPQVANSATLFRDADGATTTVTGATGTWNTTTALWRNGSSTGTLQNWSDTTGTAGIAGFGGTVGIATSLDRHNQFLFCERSQRKFILYVLSNSFEWTTSHLSVI